MFQVCPHSAHLADCIGLQRQPASLGSDAGGYRTTHKADMLNTQLINGATDPYYVRVQAGTYDIPSTPPCDAALPCRGLSDGQIAGIVIGVVLGVALIVAIICYWKREAIRDWWAKGYRGPKRG